MKLLTADQLNSATFIGIDAHPDSHTALAINRFKKPQGHLAFANTTSGITTFREWINALKAQTEKIIVIGIEGGSTSRNALVKSVLGNHELFLR